MFGTHLRRKLISSLAALSLLMGIFAAAPASPAAASSLSISIHCEAGAGRFICDSYVSGGSGNYSYYWKAVSNASIQSGYTTTASTQGYCRIGSYARVRLTVNDGGITTVKERSFYCYSEWQ